METTPMMLGDALDLLRHGQRRGFAAGIAFSVVVHGIVKMKTMDLKRKHDYHTWKKKFHN